MTTGLTTWRCVLLTWVLIVLAACSSGADDNESTTTSAATTISTSTVSSSISPSTTSSAATTTASSTTTSSTPPVRCVELLQIGCEGDGVERLQRLLKTRVDANIGIDGQFGDQTERILRAFERLRCPVNVCTVDGNIVIDDPEWNALDALPVLPPDTKEPSA